MPCHKLLVYLSCSSICAGR